MDYKHSINRQNLNAVARAADDLRRGQCVVIHGEAQSFVVLSAQCANPDNIKIFDSLNQDNGFFIVTHHRAKALKIAAEDWLTVRIERPNWMTAPDMEALADPTLDLDVPFKGPFFRQISDNQNIDAAIVALLKIAQLLPAALVKKVDAVAFKNDFLCVDESMITTYQETITHDLVEMAQAKVPLLDAIETRLISYRSPTGGPEHIAIVIGNPSPDTPVLTRLHSECFTGDLLASLKCDCGDQLRGAINAIEKAGGGILLYLAQEGRGIGLISKLKAYSLQEDGYDTVDANLRLGFNVDERLFAPAATILKKLGFTTIKLMTNNPQKVLGLEAAGIKISDRVAHAMPTNPHNADYLSVKKSKSGHLI